MTNRRRQGKRHKPFKGKTVHKIHGGPGLQQQVAQATVNNRPVLNPLTQAVRVELIASQAEARRR
jgi:hypothetical protein